MYARGVMRQPPFVLAEESRIAVRDAIIEVCRFRSWPLYALHVRPTHVHGLVQADAAASQIVNAWKAYATRALRSCHLEGIDRILWAHGAHSRRILSRAAVAAAIRYVLDHQGDRTAWYYADNGARI
jgi:REP element-mobilizing transposase RayT